MKAEIIGWLIAAAYVVCGYVSYRVIAVAIWLDDRAAHPGRYDDSDDEHRDEPRDKAFAAWAAMAWPMSMTVLGVHALTNRGLRRRRESRRISRVTAARLAAEAADRG